MIHLVGVALMFALPLAMGIDTTEPVRPPPPRPRARHAGPPTTSYLLLVNPPRRKWRL